MKIEVRPLELQWSEWTDFCRKLDASVKAVAHEPTPDRLLAVVSDWNRTTRAWLTSLSENRRRDLVSLAQAEAHFLWQLVHDARPVVRTEYLGDLRFDFRQRWFDLMPLALMLKELDISNVSIEDVGAEAAACGWLP